ncbi:ATP-binding protein [Vibrio sp. WXL103]|uniref:ATP-binding protein n=1 Tax=Vibrio sp. WXL103 TaxID=3450710 RepID=UPI003EC59EEF
MTLRSKTIIGIALIEALALGLLIISGLSWLKSSNEQQLQLGSSQLASVFASASRDAVIATDLAYLDSFAQSVASEHNLAYIRILDQGRQVLTTKGDYDGVDTSVRPFDVPDGVYDVVSEIQLNGQVFGYVEMGVKVEGLHQVLELATQASLIIAGVEMSLVALFSFALGTYLMRRLDLLRKGVVQVTKQGPGAQISISGNDEVTRVGEAFNQMSLSLAEAQQKLQQEYLNQQRLTEKVTQLAQVAEHARDVIIITGPNGKITWVNPAFEQLTEYTLEEVIGLSPGDLLQGEGTDKSTVTRLSDSIREHQPIRVEILNYTKSRRSYWVELDVTPVKDKYGRLQRYIAVERDISDRIEIEKQLSSALDKSNRAAQAKSEFLANMSHEIRTPMNAIMGISELLMQDEQRTEQLGQLKLLHQSADNLVTVINDILDYSKIEAGKLSLVNEAFDLRELVESCCELCAYQANKKGLILLVDMPASLNSAVMADKGRINQILLNLLGNAIKFTDTGYVLLRVSPKESAEHHGYLFEVIDTGIGIPPERLPYIMDKFEQADNSVTRQYEGTGLGLAISKHLIDMYHGELSVTSQLGQGSCFCFELWLSAQTQPTVVAKDRLNAHLTIVDDCGTRAELIARMARDLGLTISHHTELTGSAVEIEQLKLGHVIVGQRDIEAQKNALDCIEQVQSADFIHAIEPSGDTRRSQFGRVLRQPITYSKLSALYQQPAQSVALASNSTLCDFSDIKLLVAEDSDINRILISSMLKDTNINLTLAEDGVEAVRLYQQVQPDLVITDISMPNKDGFTVTKEIRAMQQSGDYPWCPIIAFSAHALLEERQKGVLSGMDDYLTKPVKKAQLLEMIEKWMRGESALAKRAGTEYS